MSVNLQPSDAAKFLSRARRVLGAAFYLDLVMVVFTGLGLLILLMREGVLPDKFSYDGLHIQALAQGAAPGYGDASFELVAAAYKAMGMATHPKLASLMGFGLAVLVALIIRRRLSSIEPSLLAIAMTGLYLLFAAIYLGYYSKEVFALIISALVLLMPAKKRYELPILASMLLYAALFRSYWFLVAALYLAFRCCCARSTSIPRFLFFVLLGAVLVPLGVDVFMGVQSDYFRSMVNQDRVGVEDASSLIHSYVTLPDPAGGTANMLLTALFFVLPLPLASLGGPYYLLLAFIEAVMWLGFFKCVQATPAVDPAVRTRAIRGAVLVLAFLITQSLFEPDYGSSVKHLVPLMPLMLYVIHSAGNGFVLPKPGRPALIPLEMK